MSSLRAFLPSSLVFCLFILWAASALADAGASDNSQQTVDEDLLKRVETDAEKLGEKVNEASQSVAETAEQTLEAAGEAADTAYGWTKKQGQDAYRWSKETIQKVIP